MILCHYRRWMLILSCYRQWILFLSRCRLLITPLRPTHSTTNQPVQERTSSSRVKQQGSTSHSTSNLTIYARNDSFQLWLKQDANEGISWWCDVAVSVICRTNEVTLRTSGPVSTGMGDRLRAGIPSRYVTSQLGQLSLASLRSRLIKYQFRLV